MAQDKNIPASDAAFDIFQKQFVTVATKTPAQHGLTDLDGTALTAGQTAWQSAYGGYITAVQNVYTASKTKEEARAAFEAKLRIAAQKVHLTAGADNAVRAGVGLPPRDGVRTAVAPPLTRPLGRLKATGPHTMALYITDELTPTRPLKPRGVRGCEIYVFIGDQPPVDPTGYAFRALSTRTRYLHEHAPADAGKTVTYRLRWQNTKGETGPFSQPVTTKIPL